jgi:hypothetical protein
METFVGLDVSLGETSVCIHPEVGLDPPSASRRTTPHCRRGNNAIDSRLPLGQLLRPLSDLPAATFANHQTERLQDTAQLVVDANAHVDQLVPSD